MSCVQVFGSVYLAKYVKCWQAEQQVSYILVKSLRTMEISQMKIKASELSLIWMWEWSQ